MSVAPPPSGATPPPPASHTAAAKPKKKRRVFLWVFLAIQVLFLIWIIGGAASVDSGDCGTLDQQTCDDATAVGAGIGIFLIIMLWAFVDIILGFSYLIYKLAKRS